MMKIRTAEVRLSNAIRLVQEDQIHRSEFDRRLTRILRGVWLDNGIDAVNQFTDDTMLTLRPNQKPFPGICNIHGMPVVKNPLTDDDMRRISLSDI